MTLIDFLHTLREDTLSMAGEYVAKGVCRFLAYISRLTNYSRWILSLPGTMTLTWVLR
jgi:hypothetical protein